MAIIQTFNGASIRVPGAYSSQRVILAGNLPLAETGIVGIVGEATKGAPGSVAGILEYDSSTLSDLVDEYGSGPIVDAARALINGSNDSRVVNGASRILIYKTNASTQSSLVINQNTSNAWATLTSRNYGIQENQINTVIEEDTAEDFVITLDAWVTQPGSDLTFRVNGGAVGTFTAASMGTIGASTTEINSKLNTALGTVAIAYATNNGTRIQIDLALSGSGAPRNGAGIALEFIASSEYADIGVPVGLQGVVLAAGSSLSGVSATNATRSITVNRQSDQITESTENTTGELGGVVYLEIGCNAATTAVMTINSTTLSTTVVGAGASNLSITLGDFDTLQDLATYIDAQTGYSCSVPVSSNASLPTSVLDRVSAVGICASTSGLKPGQIKADSYEVQNWFDRNSTLVSMVRNTTNGYRGFPDVLAQTFLAGGTLGASTTANFNSGFVAFESKRVNTIIPLVSQDASDDLAEDPTYTDPSSSYDVESIHVIARNHCRLMSNTQNRSERNCYLGYRGTFQQCKDESNNIASEFASMAIQDAQVISGNGELAYFQPHITACLAASLQAGSEIGEPITYKFVAANGIRFRKKQGIVATGSENFNSENLGDKNQAIDEGLLIFEAPSSGGIRVVVGNTTYQRDANFVFNRISVLESAHYVAYNLRQQLESIYIGTKAKTGTAESIRNSVIAIMKQFLDADIIVGDDTNSGLGWKNLSVVLNGNTATIDITITPVVGIDFILAKIFLDNIRSTA